VTNADRILEDRVRGLLTDAPHATFLIAAERRGGSRKWHALRSGS
jgi:hypothetical protein